MSVAAPPLLEVVGLTTEFPGPSGPVRAVTDVSLRIDPGRVVGVVGESGSGKSVTARSVMRMVRSPGRIVSGQVLWRGEDLLGVGPERLRRLRGREIAMIFQDPQAALNPVMRVGDQVVEALRVHGQDTDSARVRASELFAQVGIPDVERTLRQYPHEFSGGMRQRVVIAIALANKPSLLIADEPTTALDVTIQAQILRLLVDLRRELDVAIMMITHDMGVVAELCDEVLVMYGGRVVEQGTVGEVFAEPRHPYTHALLQAVPRLGVRGGRTELTAIPGAPPDPSDLPSGCSFHPRCAVAIERCRYERPVLADTGSNGGHRSACWVAAQGGRVSVPDSGAVIGTRHEEEHEPTLVVRDLRVDVGSRRTGLLRTAPPVYPVDGVSLEVRPGETLGLVGESGCGKSTLSRAIVGITPAVEGSISVAGHDVTAMRPEDRRVVAREVQYVFQDPSSSLNPRRTVGQSLAEALAVAGTAGPRAEQRARELMGLVGLRTNQLDRFPYQFSGGQRQRVGVARALAADPRLLILDEPVSALDVSIQAQIINLLEHLRDELGVGYLFIAHDLSVVRHLSDRVAVMYLGRIIEYGSAEQVYGSPQHPYTASLLSSSPQPDVGGRERKRITLSGDMPSPAAPPSGCRFRTRCPIGPLFRPEREICATTPPGLEQTASGQQAACHFAGELTDAPAGRMAR